MPIIVHMLKPEMPCVVYTSMKKIGCDDCFFITDVYTYIKASDSVVFSRYHDEISQVEGARVCILFLKSINHFMVVNHHLRK